MKFERFIQVLRINYNDNFRLMKCFFCVIIAFALAFTAYSQDAQLSTKELRKLNKQLKKEQQGEEESRKAEIVRAMVHYQRFVLEADRLRNKQGTSVHVSSMINFIATDSIHGVIQIGSNAYIGLNGVGGITIEGPVSDYKYSQNQRNKTFNVSYSLNSNRGHYDVRMNVFLDGRAEAIISSNWPGQLNYIGYLIPPSRSKVFKGTSY